MTGEEIQTQEPSVRVVQLQETGRTTHTLARFVALVATTLVLGATVWYANEWKSSLRIRRVLIEGNHVISATEIFQLANIGRGARMFAADLNQVRKNVMNQLYIRSALVTRELPNALRVQVEERRPVAAVSQESLVFLDEDGFVLPPYESTTMADVPFITGLSDAPRLRPGEFTVHPQVLHALGLLRQARDAGADLYHLISEIHLEQSGEIVLYSSDAGVTILLGKGDVRGRFLLLKTFWNQAVSQHGAERLRLVDLRFDDQVIARWRDVPTVQTRKTAF